MQAGLSRRDCTQKHPVARQELRKHNPYIRFWRGLRHWMYYSAPRVTIWHSTGATFVSLREKTMSGVKRLTNIYTVLLAMLLLGLTGSILRAQTLDENALKAMKWRQVGPFRGGRALSATGVAGDSQTYYFGAVAGGVWKTTNGGMTWAPMTDKTGIMSVGAIAVAPSDPNVIYVGTGESCWRGDISYGDGMYKSIDAGKTWTHIGLEDTRHISRVIVHPTNPDVLFVAAMGHAYGPNETRGVFRSADGGKTWQKVLFKDNKTGAIDLTFDPSNPHILFASLYESQRYPWTAVSGGPGSGLYKSI